MADILVRKGLVWNSIQQIGQLGLNFLSLLILARILTPEDYGIYASIMIFVSISEILADSGIGGYMIKKQDVTEIYYDTLFVYNMAISIFLYLVLFIAAPSIADFYEKPEITSAIRVTGVAIVVSSFGIVQVTKLLKSFEFKKCAMISITSGSIAFVVALCLAYLNFGYWSLIAQQLIVVTFTTVGYLMANRHIPNLKFSRKAFKEQFAFGVNLLGANILKVFSDNISNNVVAKGFSMSQAGQFFQASRMQTYPIQILSAVVDRTFFPYLSKLNNDLGLFTQKNEEVCRLILAMVAPLIALIFCFAKEIVVLVLGSQWVECTIYLRILILSAYPMMIWSLNRNVLKSLGLTRFILFIETSSFIVLLLCLFLSVFIGHVTLICVSFILTRIYSAAVSQWKINHLCSLKTIDSLRARLLFSPVIVAPIATTLVSDMMMESLAVNVIIFVLTLYCCERLYFHLNIHEYDNLIKGILRKVKR